MGHNGPLFMFASPEQRSNLTHVQTQNITFGYIKQGIVAKYIHILQDKRPVGI
jgi:hypothetical protein